MAQILVVEDEESLLQTLRYNLTRAGHEVRLSTNGLQALDMIRGNPPELVVLDLMVPGLDGLELCRAAQYGPKPQIRSWPKTRGDVGDTRTVDVHVRWRPGKIEPDPTLPQRIQTGRGIGYVFQE
ncbi:MAG: DNA-binding response regulator [Chloroflexota bacterium]|nr:DNA-binding response regulator [Chloroflexota bacterium]